MEDFEYLQWISKIYIKKVTFPYALFILFIYKSTKLSTFPNNFRPITSKPLVYRQSTLLEGYSGSIPMN